ncbi:S8 family peptidase [Spongiactinospora sp. TRM90649]|uniref:S8 family peptidase n=1 Tax=Spongiactinospora sp. TRM90649 TaxID=3031114 RepID=UPI0023F976F9|nr:S8 family peptidase [Spongiactinospora sp. TRM90649]MDF5751438.1 S8 family peptidase [Spongiactinospora sp. TRM90649]
MFLTVLLLALFAAAPSAVIAATDPIEETDRYIVVLRPSVFSADAVADDHVKAHSGRLVGVYRHAFTGYTAAFTPAAADEVRRLPNVVSVERDARVVAFDQAVPTGIRRVFAPQNPNLSINGVDDRRINTDIAVVDTGVDAGHPDLNVVSRTDCTSGVCRDGAGTDGNGHGTHVAGIAGALDNGIGVVGMAPGARIHSVRVLDDEGAGSLSGMAAGMDWVARNAATIEIANLSLGCENCASNAINTAIANAVNRGVVVVAAAGNGSTDAAGFFPASHPDVITVSALNDIDGLPGGRGGDRPACRPDTDRDDTLATTSNYGRTIELTAPGVCINSTWPGGGYAMLTGTSMATPHVSGAAGVLAAGSFKPTDRAGVMAIRQRLISTGNSAWTDESPDGVKEPLLDVHDATQFPLLRANR